MKNLSTVEDTLNLPENKNIYELAVKVLGTKNNAHEWMLMNLMGINQRRPIDLLDSPENRETLVTFLSRIDYGIYC